MDTDVGHGFACDVTKLWPFTKSPGVSTPLTWFKTTFPMPADGGQVVVSMSGTGRGHFYVNGVDMGRCVHHDVIPDMTK